MRQLLEFPRLADVFRFAIVSAVGVVGVEPPVAVMGDVNVGVAIAVEVAPCGTRTPERVVQARLLGDFHESTRTFAVGFVVPQNQTIVTGHE